MAPFFPLYVCRSDGKLQTEGQAAPEPNEPTTEQLKSSPNAQGVCDYYRQCPNNDPKVLDWRRKLGGMLAKEIGGKDSKDRTFILADLPENYRLYEHVKYKATGDNVQSKSPKTHAGGGNDRQDAYLYGYPAGRKKRFRSPNEFFPHLLWLVTDKSGDVNNCSCKFCTPEEMETDKEKEKEKQPRTSVTAVAAEAKPKAPLSRPGDVLKQPPKERKPIVQQQPQPLVSQLGRPVSAMPQNAQRAPNIALEPGMLPRPKTMEQRLDQQPGKHLYRSGEVVWFKKGLAWGLGVIAKRDNDPKPTNKYRIQPLSHPFHQPNSLELSTDQLRPWLAWSPPPTTCAGLRPDTHNGFQQPPYDSVDWNLYIQGRYGQGDGEVDGSILAARQAEMTYTPFQPGETSPMPNTPQPQGRETYYNGIFIGTEKIWIGDALRLRYSTNMTDIMVLHNIVEQPILNPTSWSNQPQTRILLEGDTYSLSIAQLDPHNLPKDDLHLPSRVRAELEYKNKVTEAALDPKRRFTSYWRITAKSVRLGIEDIKGRWYESSLLLPILDAISWAQRQSRGDIPDASCYMNGQGDCNKPDPRAPNIQIDPRTRQAKHHPADRRVPTREQAFGSAVPRDFKIHKGLDEGKDGTRPGSSNGGAEWSDPNSRATTRPGSAMSAVAEAASTPATSPGRELPGFGQEYSSQQFEEKGDVALFGEQTDGLGDISMGGQ